MLLAEPPPQTKRRKRGRDTPIDRNARAHLQNPESPAAAQDESAAPALPEIYDPRIALAWNVGQYVALMLRCNGPDVDRFRRALAVRGIIRRIAEGATRKLDQILTVDYAADHPFELVSLCPGNVRWIGCGYRTIEGDAALLPEREAEPVSRGREAEELSDEDREEIARMTGNVSNAGRLVAERAAYVEWLQAPAKCHEAIYRLTRVDVRGVEREEYFPLMCEVLNDLEALEEPGRPGRCICTECNPWR